MALTTIEELSNTRNEILKGAEQIRQQRQGYADIFNEGNPLTQKEFDWLLAARQNSSDPEKATQQVAQAMLISHNYGVSIDDAIQNMGVYTQELLGREPEYTKTGLRTISDRLKIGDLGVEYQELTYAYKQADLNAEKAKDANEKKKYEEERDSLKAQIEGKLNQMEELRKHLPDSMWNTLVGGLMENLPQQWDMFKSLAYGAAMTTAGLAVGSFVAGMPIAAPIALGSAVTLLNSGAIALGAATGSFLRMKDLQEGAMYYELVNQGVEKDIANWASYADGLIEAGIEMGFGVTPAVGSAVFKSLGVKKIAKQAAMKAFSSGTMGRIGMFFTKLLKTGAGEGAEEGVQRAASDLTKCVVSAMSKSGYDPDVSMEKSIKEGMYEVLMGAWVGTVLGVFPVSLELHADIKYAKSLKQDAESTATKQQFVDNHKGDEAFKDMKEEDTTEFLGNVYDKNQEEASRKFDEMTQVRQKYRDKRRGMLNKEEEELNAQEDSDYKKQRLDAIAKEREHLENVEKWDAVSDAKWREDKLREKYINDQTEENREAWEKQRGVRDELERNMGRPDEVAEYEELGSRINELDEDELKRYTDLGFNQNVQDWYERKRTYQPQEEEQDWQKSPEDIERAKSEPKNIELDIKDREDIGKLTEKADFRTWVSESGRIMRKYMDKDTIASLEDHYNVKDGRWTVEADNRFADDVSTFMATGQAPVSSLKQSFKAVADNLLGVYQNSRARVSQDINEAFRKMSSDQRSVYYGQNKYNYQTETVRAGEQPSEVFQFTNPVEFDKETVDMGGGIEQTIRSMRNYTNPDGTKPDGIIINDGADKTYVRFSNERTGNVYLDNFTTKPTQMQKDSIEMLGKVVADVTHNDVFVYESVEKDGQRVFAKDVGGHKAGTPAPNGFYDPSTSSIYIDLNAGNNGEGVMLWTASHELTHFVKQWSPEKFDELAEFLTEEYGKQGVDMKTLVQRQIDKAKAQGREMSYDEAYEEVVADSMQTMFTDTNLAEKLEKLRAKDADLWQRIKAFIVNLYNRLMDAYRNFAPQTQEAELVRKMADAIDKISDKFANAIVDAGGRFEEYGVYVADDALIKDSLRTWNETDKEELLNLLVDSGKDKTEAKSWIRDTSGVAKMIADDTTRLDFTSDDSIGEDGKYLFSMMKTDSEYYLTIDASTLCTKRRYYQGTSDAILKERPNYVFTEDDMIWLRQKLMENGHEAFCSFCYVESRRKLLYKFAAEFKETYKGEYNPSMYELTSLEGNFKLRKEHPEAYRDFIKAMSKKGSNSPKVVQPRTSYKREILDITPDKVKKLNHIGGLRWQSYSDLDIVNIIDVMQSIMDASTLKDKEGNPLNGQAYTKVPAFAASFGSTNLKINCSVVASVDKKGNLVFDNIEGMDIKDAKKMRKMYSDTVGTILVGSDERQIRAAMESGIIDFIIPFHRSGWSLDNAEKLGLKGYLDHTALQHDVKADYSPLEASRKKAGGNYFPDQYWDYSVDGNTNAMTYLNMCLDDGRLPRFLNYAFKRDAAEAFVKANPDIMVKIPSSSKPVKLTADILLSVEGMTSLYNPSNSTRNQRAIAYNYLKFALENGFETTDGYWKTLIDFKMYNNDGVGVPQKGLIPKFNMEQIRKYMNAYEGGVDTLPVDEQAKRDFLEHIKDREDLKYSQRAYHGSGAEFEAFNTEYMSTGAGSQNFGWGVYLTGSENIARDYAQAYLDTRYRDDYDFYSNGKKVSIELYQILKHRFYENELENAINGDNKAIQKRLKDDIIAHKKSQKKYHADLDVIDKVIKKLEDKDITFAELKKIGDDTGIQPIMASAWDVIGYENNYEELTEAQRLKRSLFNLKREREDYVRHYIKGYEDAIAKLETIDIDTFEAREKDPIKRNLYTTSIPDDTGNNYLYWDEELPKKQYERIIDELEKRYPPELSAKNRYYLDRIKYNGFTKTGQMLYRGISDLMESPEDASRFLNSLGYVGMNYPAGTIWGTPVEGARNYVIYNPDDITIDDHLMYSAREQNEETYQQATENGEYVPDIVLERYRESEWAREEIEVRQDYKNIINSEYRVMSAEDADNDDNGFAQFVTAMKENDPHKRTTRYYEQMWEAATATKNIKYTDAFKNMSKRMLETLLQNLNKFQKKGKLQETPEGVIAEAMQLFKDKEELSDEDFSRIMADIASSEDKANKALAYLEECFSDPEDFKKMMLAVTASPDVFAIREINKYVKGNEHYRNTTMRKLAEDINTLREFIRDVRNSFVSKEVMKEKLAQLKQAYKDRALFNKCMRMIFRKVSGMCAADQHDEIIAIQDKYSKTSMMDSTRENLQQAYDKETNPKRKADLKKRLDQISLKELPLNEVVAIADHVAKLRHDGLVARIAYEAEVKEYRLGWIDRLIDALGKVTKLDKSGSVERKLINGKHPYRRFMGAWGDVFRMSESMGKAWVELFDQVHDAHRNEVENRYRRRKAAVDEMKRLGLKTTTLAQPEVLSNGLTYTHDALLSYYIYTKNADSYAALLYGNLEANGNDLTSMDRADAFLKEAISKLSKAEKQFGDWMMKSFTGDDWKRLNFVIRNVDNRSVEKIMNYFPMWRDLDTSANPMEEPLIDAMGRTNGRMGVQKGFSHNRIHDMYWRSQKPIQLGAMRIFMRAIEDQEHYIAFAQLSKDLNYIYGNVKEYVTAKFGDDYANDMQMWIDRIINPRAYNSIHKKRSAIDKLAGKITVAKLAANAVAIIKQLPSVTLFLPYTDPISMLTSMLRYIEDYKGQTEFAKSRSPDFRVRSMDDLIKENLDALADPNYFVGRLAKLRRAEAQTNKVLMSPFSVFDGIACTIGWNAVYIHEMAKGSTEEKAIRQADKAYLKTQPQSEALYSPLIFDKQGWRLFLMFQRQANQVMQMIFFDIPNKWRNADAKTRDKWKFTLMSAFVVAFNGLIMDWISRKFKPYGDEDDDDFFKEGWFGDMMKGTTSSMAQNIPIIGKPIAALIQRQNYTSSGFVDPVSTTIYDAGNLLTSTIKKGELDADKVAKVITDAMGAAGLPEVATYRLYKASREDDLVDKMWTAVIGTPLGGKKLKKKTYFKKK